MKFNFHDYLTSFFKSRYFKVNSPQDAIIVKLLSILAGALQPSGSKPEFIFHESIAWRSSNTIYQINFVDVGSSFPNCMRKKAEIAKFPSLRILEQYSMIWKIEK